MLRHPSVSPLPVSRARLAWMLAAFWLVAMALVAVNPTHHHHGAPAADSARSDLTNPGSPSHSPRPTESPDDPTCFLCSFALGSLHLPDLQTQAIPAARPAFTSPQLPVGMFHPEIAVTANAERGPPTRQA